jgi:ketosteroid isomerase-like protein
MTETDHPFLNRLCSAVNAHDLAAVVECFADDYRCEMPAHPARNFSGKNQVRANWTKMFALIPDIRAEVLASAVDDETLWSEWEMSGTSPDGSAYLVRGAIVFGLARATSGDRAGWSRFYIEPVEKIPDEGVPFSGQ